MRLLHLTNIPTPYRVYFLNLLSQRLSTYGVELIVVYMGWREPRRLWSINPNDLQYKWINLRALPIDMGNYVLWIDFKFMFLLLSERVDILLTAGSWNMPAAIISSLPFPLFPKFKIFWCEGHDKSVLNPSGLIASFRKFILKQYDGFAIPSKASAEFINSQVTSSKIILDLPNLIEESVFLKHRALLNPSSIRNLVVVAALEKRKGWLSLLNALRLISPDYLASFMIHICGDGDLYPTLREEFSTIGVQVIFHGQQNTRRVAEILSDAHAFLLPSLYDPNPLSAIEALSVGLPLLLSRNCGNVDECVTHLSNGWTFDTNKPSELASCIISWLDSDIHRLREMGTASYSCYLNKFTSSVILDEFISQLFDNLPKSN